MDHSGPRIAITGFGPFDGVDENPTEIIVDALRRDGVRIAGAEPLLRILPVEYDGVVAPLLELVRDQPLDALVLTGLRTSSDDVCIERVALNLDDASRPDNAGEWRRGTHIEPDGPGALFSPLDLDSLVGAFTGRGIAARVSNHAGAFICNRSFYLARREIERLGAPTRCVFVHVPWIGHHPITVRSGEPLGVPRLAEAITDCARRLALAGA